MSDKTMYRFKLLRGRHSDSNDSLGKPIIHKPGDTFESEYQLDSIHNSPGSTKFERLPDTAPIGVAAADDGYSSMTVTELRVLAAEEEIDLTGATRKVDVIDRIRSQLSP